MMAGFKIIETTEDKAAGGDCLHLIAQLDASAISPLTEMVRLVEELADMVGEDRIVVIEEEDE